MAEVQVVKTIGGLKPTCADGEELFSRWGLGDTLLVTVKKPRNAAYHRKFFAMLNIGFDNQSQYTSFEEFREAVIIDAGYYDRTQYLNGCVRYIPKSISFAKMEELEFKSLFDAAIDSVLKLLPGTTRQEIIDEIAAF